MTYVDGFILSIKKEDRAKYKKIAKEAAEVWKKFGALDYKECRSDDVNPPGVTLTFPKVAKSKEGEETWFSFIVFSSKAERNRINKAVIAHFDAKYNNMKEQDMPFDIKRMVYGGFKAEVELP
jgi:uncharacterized protein YbaA (DUF1428 family)